MEIPIKLLIVNLIYAVITINPKFFSGYLNDIHCQSPLRALYMWMQTILGYYEQYSIKPQKNYSLILI
jgi:hypothetical protein